MEVIEKAKKITERVSPVRKQYNANVISARLSGILLMKATMLMAATNYAINNP
jgi:formiminotetrahydrofolate cyclodeaminase